MFCVSSSAWGSKRNGVSGLESVRSVFDPRHEDVEESVDTCEEREGREYEPGPWGDGNHG